MATNSFLIECIEFQKGSKLFPFRVDPSVAQRVKMALMVHFSDAQRVTITLMAHYLMRSVWQ